MSRKHRIRTTQRGSLKFELDLGKDYCVEVWLVNSKKNGGIEGKYVRIETDIHDGWEEWSKNIFGRGLYASEIAEKHYKAVCNCLIYGYELYIPKDLDNVEYEDLEAFEKYLYEQLSDVRVKVDPKTDKLKDEPVKFKKLFDFEKKWGNNYRFEIEGR